MTAKSYCIADTCSEELDHVVKDFTSSSCRTRAEVEEKVESACHKLDGILAFADHTMNDTFEKNGYVTTVKKHMTGHQFQGYSKKLTELVENAKSEMKENQRRQLLPNPQTVRPFHYSFNKNRNELKPLPS